MQYKKFFVKQFYMTSTISIDIVCCNSNIVMLKMMAINIYWSKSDAYTRIISPSPLHKHTYNHHYGLSHHCRLANLISITDVDMYFKNKADKLIFIVPTCIV